MEENEEPVPEQNFDWKLLQFFVKIIRTVFIGMFWMLVNIFVGLYLGFAVPEESTTGRLIGFYTWLVLSGAGYIYYLWRIWRHKMPAP